MLQGEGWEADWGHQEGGQEEWAAREGEEDAEGGAVVVGGRGEVGGDWVGGRMVGGKGGEKAGLWGGRGAVARGEEEPEEVMAAGDRGGAGGDLGEEARAVRGEMGLAGVTGVSAETGEGGPPSSAWACSTACSSPSCTRLLPAPPGCGPR